MAYRFLPKHRSGNRPGHFLVEPIEDERFADDVIPDFVDVVHDGQGNVTVIAPGWIVTKDENGDLRIVGNKISITNDEIGEIEMRTITINGIKFDVVDQTARDNVDEVKSSIIGVYRYKGSVDSIEDLPMTDNEPGDVYDVKNNITGTGMNYAWNGTEWDALGEIRMIETISNDFIDNLLDS